MEREPTESTDKDLGPYRIARPGEKYDPDDAVVGQHNGQLVRLIPMRRYPLPEINEQDENTHQGLTGHLADQMKNSTFNN
jgi:hypothetical protein